MPSKRKFVIDWPNPLKPLTFVLLLALTGCGAETEGEVTGGSQQRNQMGIVQARGELQCGVSGELPGFSFSQSNGDYVGLDVDICRAIAAAMFNDAKAVEFRNLNAKERFTALPLWFVRTKTLKS